MKKLISLLMFIVLAGIVFAQPALNHIPAELVNEGDTIEFNITCSAPDNGTTTFTKNVTIGTLTKINDTLATFSYSPGYDVAGSNTHINYDILFTAQDVDSEDNRSMLLTVANMNAAPSITSTAVTSGVQSVPYTYTVTADDPDGDSLTYSMTSTEPTLAISATGVVSGVPAAVGTYDVNITVDDGSATDTQDYVLTVAAPTKSVSVGDVSLGGNSQKKSNPDESYVVQLSKSFKIENTGDLAITNMVVTSDAASDYELTFTNAPTTLAAGANAIVTLTAKVPEDLDAVSSQLVAGPMDIGNILVSGDTQNGTVQGTGDIEMQVKNNLVIRDVDIEINGINEDVDDDEEVDEIQPGDRISIAIEIENLFSDNTDETDIDIDDIEIKIEIDDNDFDVDEDDDIGTLNAEEEEVIEFKFTVPDDLEEDDYDMTIEVFGKDEFGGAHGEKWEITLKVEREQHDIVISKSSLSPRTVICDRRTTLSVTVMNVGQSDEDEVAIEATNSDLGILERVKNLDLEEDDRITRTFRLDIPQDVKPGTYVIQVDAMYSNDIPTDVALLDLTVKDCGPTVAPTPKPTTKPVIQPTPTPTVDEPVVIPPVMEPTQESSSTLAYIIILIFAILVMAVVGVVLIVKLLV
ncbi:MAG: putative S-layer protein [Candidatus Thorarchaeota archaeon]